jgi:hypothetical protein
MQFVDPKIKQRERIIAHHHKQAPQFERLHVICSWCERTKVRGVFMYVPAAKDDKPVSHGICKTCLDKIIIKHNKEAGNVDLN